MINSIINFFKLLILCLKEEAKDIFNKLSRKGTTFSGKKTKWSLGYNPASLKTALNHLILNSLREKCPNTEFFLVRTFLYSGGIRRFTEKIQSNYRKIQTRKNPVFGHFSRSDFYLKVGNIVMQQSMSISWEMLLLHFGNLFLYTYKIE